MTLTLEQVRAEAQRFGPIAYVATSSRSGTPYVSPVAVAWVGDEVAAFVRFDEAKVANVRAGSVVCVHWAVGEATGWDSLMVWGSGRLVDTVEGRRALWGSMGYGLDPFEPGGPESDDHVFLLVRPAKAVVLRQYGIGGRDEWHA